jgi:hypothetical protein
MHRMYRVDDLLFDGWYRHAVAGGFTDTFELYIDALCGLPPHDYAQALETIGRRLGRLRPRASLWFRVHNLRGRWYLEALRDGLQNTGVSFAVTPFEEKFDPLRFTFWPVADRVPSPKPPEYLPEEPYWGWVRSKRLMLQAMARLGRAYTREVASMVQLGRTQAYNLLVSLEQEGWVERMVLEDGYDYWQIRRKGLSAALRLWRIPPGQDFEERHERENPQATHHLGRVSKHNRTKRLWRDWLMSASFRSQVVIYAVWSEVALPVNTICDALAWGEYEGRETLFWLEVLSSKKNRENLRYDVVSKSNAVAAYLGMYGVPIILAFLGQKWTLGALGGVFGRIPKEIAVIAAPWTHFGRLPTPKWGDFQYLV